MTGKKCLCEPTEILIFPCSGGSNVGQIANEAAINLTTNGHGKMYCLAGIGSHVSGIIESTKTAKRIVAIDDCPVHCAKNALEYAGFKPDVHVVVTDLGIKKESGFDIEDNEIEKVIQKIRGFINEN
ncbi:MAG: zinc-binding protein [Candidatus Asgardarchaeum californiense]|nr:MAG: zinc-binding protein [Candidatus Asgardarchaeum californiense]